MEIIIYIIAILFVIISVFLMALARFVVRPRVRTLEYEQGLLLNLDYMKNQNIEVQQEYIVKTFDGHKLWVGLVQDNPTV